mmetsp:Transcript_151789/g.485132  ORF Transcript_151789/g.485132 Transcript_151789/m.485132 type:complete len:924 (-) Transcript_151789:93-2864(-)
MAPLGIRVVFSAAVLGSSAATSEEKTGGLGQQWAKLYRGIAATPWSDHHTRHKFRPGDGTAQKIQEYMAKRRLMDVTDPDTDKPYGSDPSGTYTPRMDGKAKMNGELMDYGVFDCPWEKSLDPDYPAMCLPYQQILSPFPDAVLPTAEVFKVPGGLVGDFATRDASFVMPDGSTMECSDEIERLTGARCAAGNAALGHGAICEGFVEGCTFSKPGTRKCDSDKCKAWHKKTRCTGSECTSGYEEARVPYPETYPGNNGGAFTPQSDADEASKCSKSDSVLQWLKCGIPCPVDFPMEVGDLVWQGVAVIGFMVISLAIGVFTYFKVKGDSSNYFVAGRNLPTWILVATLGCQCLDASTALGNLDLAYKYHFWDGAALPLGLALSLIIMGVFFAKPMNDMNLLTLPDAFARFYGEGAEVVCSLVTLISFTFLLAGNLVGCGKIVSFLFGMDQYAGIMISTFLIWVYASSGGLLSVAYTDVVQGAIGWTGFIIATAWIQNSMPNHAGVSAAYPVGDQTAYGEGVADADSYEPVPNAVFFNWVTVIVLAFGNCMALDFHARCFSAKNGNAARMGCIIAGIVAGTIGIANTFNAGTTRALYGPSSPHAEFVANSCSAHITVIGCFGGAAADPSLNKTCNAVPLPGVPTCGEWKPDPYANLKMLTCSKPECHFFADFDGSGGYAAGTEDYFPMNAFLGGWYLLGIVAASMSTAAGAIVAMGTVFSHNLLRKTGKISETNLLPFARASTLLFSIIAGLIAMTRPNETGYFLIVAFDCVFAAGVVPLFALVYWKGIKPEAGFLSLVVGAVVRIILEFALPKDGLLLWFGSFARSFGPGIEDPQMFDEAIMFGKLAEVCPQEALLDMTGLDSLVSPAVSLVVLVLVQLLPIKGWGGKWFTPVPEVDADADEKRVTSVPEVDAAADEKREVQL